MPPKLVEDVVTVWEGTTDCTITVTQSNLKADKIKWLKDDKYISEDRFEKITFSEIRKEDNGTYVEEFDLTCFGGIKHFKFSFTMNVLCKLVYLTSKVVI